MFVLVHNNSVILGPVKWSRYRFENAIQEECDYSVSLLDRNDNFLAINVTDDIKILPVITSPNPEFNAKIQILHGPFWEFTAEAAISSYQVVPLPVDAVKNQLKAQAADIRWQKLNQKVEVNGVHYGTDSQTTLALQQAFVSNLEQLNWKVNSDTWVELTQTHVNDILAAISAHIQICFDWEKSKVDEINACSTLEELDAIVVDETLNGNNGDI